MFLGTRLRNLRIEFGYTQDKLANLIGVNKAAISYYETGGRTPTLEKLLKLCSVLNTDANYLLGQEASAINEDSKKPVRISESELVFLKKLSENNRVYMQIINDPIRKAEILINKLDVD